MSFKVVSLCSRPTNLQTLLMVPRRRERAYYGAWGPAPGCFWGGADGEEAFSYLAGRSRRL